MVLLILHNCCVPSSLDYFKSSLECKSSLPIPEFSGYHFSKIELQEIPGIKQKFFRILSGFIWYRFIPILFLSDYTKKPNQTTPPLPFLLCIRLNAYQLILVCCNRCKLCFWKYKAPELFALNIGDRGTFSVLPSYKVDPGLKLMHGVQDNLEQKITIKNESLKKYSFIDENPIKSNVECKSIWQIPTPRM